MENILSKVLFVRQENTRKLCFYGVEGRVKGVYYPKNDDEIKAVYNYLKVNSMPFKILGNGSNLLFSPNSKEYFCISLKLMPKKVRVKENKIFFSSAVTMASLSRICYEKGLGGIEELSSIPGSMGGIIKMNAGAFGKNIFDLLDKVKVFDCGKVKLLDPDKIEHGYRKTDISDKLILGGSVSLYKDNRCNILKKQCELKAKRELSQPIGRCCGSVFMNPQNESAGKLIELCGLKGMTKNDAIISEKHANFIINRGNASFEDIMFLINLCEEKVFEKFNIKLIREVEII